jgi:dihydrofolate synthase/folylpolyglutamate synthase
MTDPVQDVLDRLTGLHPRLIDLSLDRLQGLLNRLGNPERHLPPVIHVAGTNGKGSTCAFLRAMAEAAGLRVHVYTSPHLVRFNERIRIDSELVSDADLLATLAHVEAVNAGAPITVFEVITAAAFYLFARTPADLCVVEVGLGGRGDATNVIQAPFACAITSISLDHRELLGDTLAKIAVEKAGIMKKHVPVVIGAQQPAVLKVLLDEAQRVRARPIVQDRDWHVDPLDHGFHYVDPTGPLMLPRPALPGLHQLDNAGIALAVMRTVLPAIPPHALRNGLLRVEWPARLQRLEGRLTALLPERWELWLDGGHNPGAGEALAAFLAGWAARPAHLIVGLNKMKDAAAFLRPILPYAASVWAVAEPCQHSALPVQDVVAASGGVARPAGTVAEALRSVAQQPGPGRVLICGSLYLAGEVLRQDA